MSPKPQGPTVGHGPWCTVCGFEASLVAETVDLRYPIVMCRRSVTEHAIHCGRVVGTYSLEQAHAAYVARRWKITSSQHSRHDRDRDPVPFCHPCQDLPVPAGLKLT